MGWVESPRQRRIQIARTQLMHAVGIGVRERNRASPYQLPVHCYGRLHDVTRPQLRVDLLNDVCRLQARQGGDRRNVWEEIRIRDVKLLLEDSIEAFCRQSTR